MKVVTGAQMREMDRRADAEFGIPGVVLMEAAGIALARVCVEEVGGKASGKHIAIFCGKGNNGGDGFVAARHLANAGANITIFLLGSIGELRGDAAIHAAPLAHIGAVRTVQIDDHGSVDLIDSGPFALIVDALLGTGARIPLTGVVADTVGRINAYATAYGCPVIACDIPSGVDADTGNAEEPVVHATRTVTFALPKLGLLVYPGADYVGRLTLSDIGLPIDLLAGVGAPDLSVTTQDEVRRLVPQRTETRDANKGTFGTVLVIAGSAGMAGASALSALSALRAGAGLVMLAVPKSLLDTAAALAPEAILRPLPETPDRTHGGPGAVQAALELAEKADAVALGPGLSGNKDAVAFVKAIVLQLRKPLIIDADGLNAVAQSPECVSGRGEEFPTVLTPHPGEMGRLLNRSTADVQADRLAAARECAEKYRATALLKGSRTLVMSPTGQMAINRRGSAALATAGSGDVLTGVVGALLGQKLSAFDAARCGAYLHALAGESAGAALGTAGVLAGDVRDHLPVSRRRLYEDEYLDELC